MSRLYPALLAFCVPAAAFAQTGTSTTVDEIVVTASPYSTASVAGAAVQVRSLSPGDLTRSGAPSLIRALGENGGQVQINNAQGNPFQPNLSYRGFDASPLVGNAQGLAVYIDGVRTNQAFGDTVNWDLVPDLAIRSATVMGANPVFGLNALGGSIDLRLQTGETFQGVEAMASGGSFGRVDGSLQWGGQYGDGLSAYVAVRALDDDGWRDFSPSSVRQAYADIGLKAERHDTHLKLIVADNDLTGNGTSPVELLDARREAVFTHPDRTQNELTRLGLTTDRALSDHLTLNGSLYVQRFRQDSENGDAADVETCEAPFAAFICLEDEDDEPLTNADGDPIADVLGGEDYAFLNRGSTRTDGYGGAVQLTHAGQVMQRPNRLLVGVSFDGGRSTFRASSELGEMSEDRGYAGPGVIVESDDVGSIGVVAHNRYYGAFFSNVLDLSPTVGLTLSGRYNAADVTLQDLIGTELNGSHKFRRFNPAIGLTWQAAAGVSVYGGYSEASRAPTPAELSCADPAAPCSLTNFFVGDPPLDQVVARTVDFGLRRHGGGWRWSASAFSTDTEDDIMFISSPVRGRAYFQNVGQTRRQGLTIEAGVTLGATTINGSASYIDATFRTPLTASSPESPFADADGQLEVEPGDALPGVARTKLKLAVDHRLSARWTVSATAAHQGGQVLYGDEANLDDRTDGFTVVNLATRYDLTDRASVFVAAENLLDEQYETFGTYSPVGEVELAEVPGASNTRSLSPGVPRALFAGVRLRY